MSEKIYDFAAIGIGPFNLGLACLTAPIEGLDGIFLDRNDGFDWHPGMMLDGARLQTPFMADLVTMADPTSPFSVLNYLKQQGRLYPFYIRESFFLLREEYNRYCQWAVARLPNLRFGTEVERIDYDSAASAYRLHTRATKNGTAGQVLARKLVLGTGPSPHIPACCEPLPAGVIHSSAYLVNRDDLLGTGSITVLGSGQSAAEIFQDLLQRGGGQDFDLSWITRSPRYFPLEYTKLTLEMTSPEYVDYFHSLPPAQRAQLNRTQKQLYKGINSDLINDIYDELYARQLRQALRVNLHTNAALTRLSHSTDGLELELHQQEQDRHYHHRSDRLILATGYSWRAPAYLNGIATRIRWDDEGRYDTRRDYSIDRFGGEIFVQNAELHTHGLSTPDLGMACYRNSCIIRALTGLEHYPIEQSIAFQQFAAPAQTTFERQAGR